MPEKIDLGISEFGEDVASVIKRYAEFLVQGKLRPRSVVVVGSRVRGDWKPWSDTDVVVIAEGVPKSGPTAKLMNPDWVWGIELEPKCFSPGEFLKALDEFDLTALDAANEGIPMYDDGFWAEVRKKFERIKNLRKLEKIEDGWKFK